VTSPVSCGRGLTSENHTMSPDEQFDAEQAAPAEVAGHGRSDFRARCRAAGVIAWGCQDST
jgi:hypothetical protein